MRLRNAHWFEVEALFQGRGWQAIANAKGWADRFHVEHEDYAALPVSLEAWSHERIAAELEAMTELEPRISTDMDGDTNNAQLAPRVDGLPLVMVKFGTRYGMLDGKHRAHRWKQVPGRYAVLVIESATC